MSSRPEVPDKRVAVLQPECESELTESQRISNTGSWALDLATGHLEWSEQMYRVYAVTDRAGAARPGAGLATVHPEDLVLTDAAFKQAVEDRGPLDFVHRVVEPGGAVRHVHVKGEVTRSADGMAQRCSGTAQDITLEVMREQTLQDRERSLQAIFSAMAEGLVIHGPNGQVIEANPAAESVLGLSRDALLGKTSADPRWHAITEHGAPYPGERHPAMRTLKTGQPLRDEIMGIMDPKRGLRWISINTNAIWGQDPSRPEAVVATFVDITERRRNEQALRVMTDELHDLYERAPCGYHSVDASGKYIRVNATELAWLGCSADDLIGKRSPADFFSEAGRQVFQHVFSQLLAGGRVEGLHFDMTGPNGITRKVSLSASAVVDEFGRYVRSRGILYDVTEMQRSREQLQRLAQEQSAMLDNELLGIVKLRARRVVWKNRAMSRIFGYEPGELLGESSRLLYTNETAFEHIGQLAYAALSAGAPFRSQVEMVRKGGERIWVDLNGVLLSRESDESIWFLADITELKRYEESFERMAHIDALTGLPNRVLLADRMQQALATARRHQYSVAVVYIDLDGLKTVNETHGHLAGDRLLRKIAARLEGRIRSNDTASRLGGDEFVLLLTHLEGSVKIDDLLQGVRADIALPVTLDNGTDVAVSASVGVAMAPADGWDALELLRRADIAMYAAKKLGRNGVHFYRAADASGAPSIH